MPRRSAFGALIAIGILAGSCRSRTVTPPSALAATTQDTAAPYETVNGAPQLSVDGNQFSFYWGIWRGLSAAELLQMASLPEQQASVISRRAVLWDLHDCETSSLLHRNHEEFYYLDELQLDGGILRPLREAVRPGWRYFSMGSFNSRLAREDWGVPTIIQQQGETNRDFRERQQLATQSWLDAQTRRGQRGQILIQSEHRFFSVAPSIIRSSFVSFFDYRADDVSLLDGAFSPFNPARWPIYYDERAHKPHSIDAPAIWRSKQTTNAVREFNIRLTWNWCSDGEKPIAQFESGPDDLPSPGPNRPGRSDSGNTELQIIRKEK